jgi:hypothetical protein
MPEFLQGNIFAIISNQEFDLAVVFGHVGFNEMRECWTTFRQGLPGPLQANDPFAMYGGVPQEYSDGRWLWFVPEERNHGMDDAQLKAVLNQTMQWARQHGIRTVITNGIADVDHAHDTAANRASDDRRARLIASIVTRLEPDLGLCVTLISLNDVFTRNSPR